MDKNNTPVVLHEPTPVGAKGGDVQKQSEGQLLVASPLSASPTQPTDVQECPANDGKWGGMRASLLGTTPTTRPPPSASLTSVSSNQQQSIMVDLGINTCSRKSLFGRPGPPATGRQVIFTSNIYTFTTDLSWPTVRG
eukprot:SAG31_NODE_11576_length_1016_cov_1.310796_2_plen_138_part_00